MGEEKKEGGDLQAWSRAKLGKAVIDYHSIVRRRLFSDLKSSGRWASSLEHWLLF